MEMKIRKDMKQNIFTLLKAIFFILLCLFVFKNIGDDNTPQMINYSNIKKVSSAQQAYGSFL